MLDSILQFDGAESLILENWLYADFSFSYLHAQDPLLDEIVTRRRFLGQDDLQKPQDLYEK